MYLLTRISHLCWSGYLYLRTSDFRNIELRKSINHTIVDPPPITRSRTNPCLSTVWVANTTYQSFSWVVRSFQKSTIGEVHTSSRYATDRLILRIKLSSMGGTWGCLCKFFGDYLFQKYRNGIHWHCQINSDDNRNSLGNYKNKVMQHGTVISVSFFGNYLFQIYNNLNYTIKLIPIITAIL